MIAAVISGLLGDTESAAVILIVITLNAILGTIQTRQAERSLNSLKNLSAPKASVLRNGTVVQLPARELVPGDIVLLEAGDVVPADGRIIECAGLKIDESTLTGESLSSDKIIDAISEQAALGDRRNMVFPAVSLPAVVGKLSLPTLACTRRSVKLQIFCTIHLQSGLRCKLHLILSGKSCLSPF